MRVWSHGNPLDFYGVGVAISRENGAGFAEGEFIMDMALPAATEVCAR